MNLLSPPHVMLSERSLSLRAPKAKAKSKFGFAWRDGGGVICPCPLLINNYRSLNVENDHFLTMPLFHTYLFLFNVFVPWLRLFQVFGLSLDMQGLITALTTDSTSTVKRRDSDHETFSELNVILSLYCVFLQRWHTCIQYKQCVFLAHLKPKAWMPDYTPRNKLTSVRCLVSLLWRSMFTVEVGHDSHNLLLNVINLTINWLP